MSFEMTTAVPATASIHLFWRDLSYKTSSNKVLIRDLSGHVQSGCLTAVLGPSGSGKTTMFECLAKRKMRGVSGDIWVSSPTSDITNVRIIYNPQRDFLFSVLTVRESLTYACQLQNFCGKNIDLLDQLDSGEKSEIDDQMRVNDVIDQLGLTQCADTRVANCSGGQKKRLSIGLELMFSPNVLLLDEPTTGLDSVSSLQLIQLLKSLVQTHPIIICATIHQPSAKLFSYFDNLYVMSSWGTCLYDGPRDSLLPYLNSYNLTCPIFHNIADFVLEIASGLHGNEIANHLVENERKREVVDTNRYQLSMNADRSLSKKMAFDQIQSSWSLFRRSSLIALREPFDLGLRFLGLFMIMSIRLILKDRSSVVVESECFNATRFMRKMIDMGSDPENFKITAFLNRDIILLITSVLFSVIISLIPSLMLFPLELSVFVKEHSNKWYTRWSYYVSKSFSDLPTTITFPFLYGLFTYLMIEQTDAWRVLAYFAIIIATSLLAHSYAMVISIVFIHNQIAALISGALLFVPFFIFSGFIIPINKLPQFVRPFTYASVYKLAIEAVLVTFYGFNLCQTQTTLINFDEFSKNIDVKVWNISQCISESTSLPPIEYIIDSFNKDFGKIKQSIILSRFELNDIDLFINFGVMIVYIIVLRILAYLILKFRTILK